MRNRSILKGKTSNATQLLVFNVFTSVLKMLSMRPSLLMVAVLLMGGFEICNGSSIIQEEKGAAATQNETVEVLMTAFPSENAFTLLHFACSEGHLQIVKFLIEKGGADIEIANSKGDTALMIAVWEQEIDIVRYLIAKGARIDRANNEGAYPLHFAAVIGELELCQLLVENGAQVNPQTTESRSTPLHFACDRGHLPIVKFLVEIAGADVEIEDSDGDTALMDALRKRRSDVVRYLVSKGARIDHANNEGFCPLHFAARAGQLGSCQLLLEKGANVNLQTEDGGITPLHVACITRNLQMVKLLVETGGADVEIADSKGRTALMIAVLYHEIGIAHYLISKGARIDRANNKGYFPLHYAAATGQLELCQLLLEKGAQVNQKTKDRQRSPLQLACTLRHMQIVKLLVEIGGADIESVDSLKNGAQINRQTTQGGFTPLHLACREGHLKIVKFLVEKGGADIEIADSKGNTALMVALDKGKADVVGYLVSRGARSSYHVEL